jgi:hypothetical protein
LPDGDIVAAEPNDFVLLDNRVVQHKISDLYINDVARGEAGPRNFMRANLYNEPTDLEIRRWRAILARRAS